MNIATYAAAQALDALGYGSWQLSTSNSLACLVSIRPNRKAVVLSTLLLRDSPSIVVAEIVKALPDESHPGYEALCLVCSKRYFRSKPASADHHCATCGPVAGILEYA